ncbi:hypothetical protein HZB03_05000 [Candidatus Woesearchaeota archaeon]|nr:hypothetical protein [Candidatus Woesearchaeota archaeon]
MNSKKSMNSKKFRKNQRIKAHSRISCLDDRLKVIPPEALDMKSGDYVRALEYQYRLCTKEVSAYMGAIDATIEEAQKNLDKVAVGLSGQLGIQVNVGVRGIKQHEQKADNFLDIMVTIKNANETDIKCVYAEIYESSEAYVEQIRMLNLDMRPFVERAAAFYKRLIEITAVERVMPDDHLRPFALAQIHSDEKNLEVIIDADAGALLAIEGSEARSADDSDMQSGAYDIAGPVGASLRDLYVVKNPSHLVCAEDLLIIAVSEISRRYHEEQAQSYKCAAMVDVEAELEKQAVLKRALNLPLFDPVPEMSGGRKDGKYFS